MASSASARPLGVSPVAQELIDQMCLEENSDNDNQVFLSESAEKISDCVAGYSHFNLLHRIWNALKAVFGCSDWQKAREVLRDSLIGKNFTILSSQEAKIVADRLLQGLVLENGLFHSSTFDGALWQLQSSLYRSLPTHIHFRLGQLGFAHGRISFDRDGLRTTTRVSN